MRLIASPLARAIFISALAFFMNFAVPTAFGSDKQSEEAAKALLTKAAEVTNIEAPGGQPFLLMARTSWTQYGKTTNGQFAMAWQASDRYRRETTVPDFIEVIVTDNNVLYRTRNTDYIPLAVVRPASLLEVSSMFTIWPKKGLKMYSGQPPKGLSAASNFRCISAVMDFNHASVHHTACFDDGTGAPLIEQQQFSSGGMETLTYADYASLNGKEFPRTIKYADSTGVYGEVEITKLAAVTTFPDTTFQQPAESVKQSWCAAPRTTDAPTPWAGFDEWLKWSPGPNPELDDPLVFVAVDGKGDAQNVVPLDGSPDPSERMAVLRMRKAKFGVQRCYKTPIPYEIVVQLARGSQP